jgi:hypothetical protein
MPITFNSILTAEGFSLREVRLLRHQDSRSAKGRTPYELWQFAPEQFNLYQRTQGFSNARKLGVPYWAVFVGTPSRETLFVGMYAASNERMLTEDMPSPNMDGVELAGTRNIFDLAPEPRLQDLAGRLVIEWGPGKLAWIQRPAKHNKAVLEVRSSFQEQAFPGFLDLIFQLSQLPMLPRSWITALQSSRGVYLLTCPTTKEQYVGSATGEEAFWNRWQCYYDTGHGGNVALKSRDPSDYQISILEVAGSSATTSEIIAMEQRWKRKLQSQEMGLNRN